MATMSLVFFVSLYFVPAMIALGRSHHQAASILMINLFLGWTMLGWVAALVWSFSALDPRMRSNECPACGFICRPHETVCVQCERPIERRAVSMQRAASGRLIPR